MIYRVGGKRLRIGGKTARGPNCCCPPGTVCYPCGVLPATVDVEFSGITLTAGCWVGDVAVWHKWLAASLNQTVTLTWDAFEASFVGTIAADLGHYLDAADCAADVLDVTSPTHTVNLGCDDLNATWYIIITTGDTALFRASGSGVNCTTGTLTLTTTGPTTASSGGSALVTF